MFDNGIAPKDLKGGDDGDDGPTNQNLNPRKELAGIMYAANVMGSRGPRKMQVAVPVVGEEGKGVTNLRSGM